MVLPFKANLSQSNKAAGIILSSRGIALAIADHSTTTVRLDHAHFYPCDSTDSEHVLSELSKTHQLNSLSCHFVLNPDEYQFFQVEKPNVDASDLASALRWQVKDLIDYDVDDLSLDFLTLPTSDTHVQVVTTRKSLIQQRVDLLHQSHCQIASIDIAAQAARNLVAKVKTMTPDISVGLLNLWDNSAKISVFKHGDIYINRATAIGTDTLSTIDPDNLMSQSVVDNLAIELQRTFDYYESYARQSPVTTLFIISNSRAIPQLENMIEQRLGIECQIITPKQVDQLDLELTLHSADMTDSCLMAVGGALRAGPS